MLAFELCIYHISRVKFITDKNTAVSCSYITAGKAGCYDPCLRIGILLYLFTDYQRIVFILIAENVQLCVSVSRKIGIVVKVFGVNIQQYRHIGRCLDIFKLMTGHFTYDNTILCKLLTSFKRRYAYIAYKHRILAAFFDKELYQA